MAKLALSLDGARSVARCSRRGREAGFVVRGAQVLTSHCPVVAPRLPACSFARSLGGLPGEAFSEVMDQSIDRSIE